MSLPGGHRGGRVVDALGLGLGPGGSLPDPVGKQRDSRGRQRVVRRHLQIGVGVADGRDQTAFAGRTGHDDWTMFAPLEQCRAGIEPQFAFLLLGAVALLTLLDQQRPDVLFEHFKRFGRCGRRRGSLVRGPNRLLDKAQRRQY